MTVPAYFKEAQRRATRRAALIAGFTVERIFNEPTAACWTYCYRRSFKDGEKRCILVFDLGGGTFDTTLVQLDYPHIHVKDSGGNAELGGEDFTDRLAAFCREKFKV